MIECPHLDDRTGPNWNTPRVRGNGERRGEVCVTEALGAFMFRKFISLEDLSVKFCHHKKNQNGMVLALVTCPGVKFGIVTLA